MRTEEDEDIDYDFTELDELTHAYAVTVHSAQGSEYPCVVIPITSAWMMLQRNLLYTAVTRAKNGCSPDWVVLGVSPRARGYRSKTKMITVIYLVAEIPQPVTLRSPPNLAKSRKKLVVLVGSAKAIGQAVRVTGAGRRHTALNHRLTERTTHRP